MTKKPTDNELELRVQELEKALNHCAGSDEKLKLLSMAVEQSSEGIAVVDLNGDLQYLNHAFAEMHGYLPEELVGKNLSIFHTSDQMPAVEAANQKIKQNGSFKGEIWHVRRDGTVFPTLMHNSLILDDKGKPVGMMGTLRDIGDIKHTGKTLRESEEKYRSLVEDSADGIAIVQGLEIKFVNSALLTMFGFNNEKEMVGHKFTEFVAPEYRDQMKQMGFNREKGKNIPARYHFKAFRKDGIEFDAELSVSLVTYQGAVARQGIIRDISKEKQSQEALREGEEKYRQLFVNASIGIGIADENGKIIDFNHAMLKPGGYSWKDISKIDNIVELYYDRKERDRILALAQRQGFVDEVEVQFKRKDGTPYDALLSLRPVQIKGAPCWQAMVQDVTKRKKAEEALRQSEDRYRNLVEGQSELICRYTADWKLTFVNEAYCRYFGKQPEELIGDSFMKFLPAEDQQKVAQEHHALLSSGLEHVVHEHQVIDGKGAIRWQQWVNRAVYDRDGLLIEFQSVGRDITDRRKAEEALKESKQALKKAHDELERRVEERTQELEIKTKSLEELNTAMKVLLKKREEDKIEIENNVLTNVKELIVPYLDKVKTTQLDDQQKTLLSIIESNMNEIISPFTRQLSLKYLKLTPTEIKIANLIKHGNTTKKIATIMNISPRTVDAHRKNIRTKVGLKKKRANLRSHLLSMH